MFDHIDIIINGEIIMDLSLAMKMIVIHFQIIHDSFQQFQVIYGESICHQNMLEVHGVIQLEVGWSDQQQAIISGVENEIVWI